MIKSIFWVIIIAGWIACTRKVSPAEVKMPAGKNYDSGAFNWVYVDGIRQKLLGNEGEALKDFEQALKINPESDAAYYEMAQIVSANGDVTNAKKLLKKAIDIGERNVWYLTMMGGFYYQEKNLDSAAYYYQIAVKNFPDEENLQLTLGNLYSEDKKYDKAVSIFESLDKKYGVNENSTVLDVKALVAAGRYDEALEKANMLIRDFPDEIMYSGLLAEIYRGKGENEKARDVYRELLKKNPDDPQVQLSACDFLIGEKDYPELLKLLNIVILNNNIKKEDKISLFARLLDDNELVKNNGDKLIVALMVLEENYRNDDVVPLLRPELLVKLSKLDDAAERLDEIIKDNPDNYYAWEKLLLVYYQMKDYRDLMAKGEECATKFNRSFLAKILYANGALEMKNYQVTLDELKKAEILAGDNKDDISQILTMRADTYYRMKDYDMAFKTFEEALKVNSDDMTVVNNYAYYLAEQDRNLKEAERMARMVIEKEKGNNTYLDTYAWVLYKRGKVREASKVMEGIIDTGKQLDAEYYEHYGFILKKLHECPKAIENWNIAIKLDSTKTDLKQEIKNCEK